jgi:hypothetical protein
VIAQALWRQTERAIHEGLLPGYVTVEESSLVLRGRLPRVSSCTGTMACRCRWRSGTSSPLAVPDETAVKVGCPCRKQGEQDGCAQWSHLF